MRVAVGLTPVEVSSVALQAAVRVGTEVRMDDAVEGTVPKEGGGLVAMLGDGEAVVPAEELVVLVKDPGELVGLLLKLDKGGVGKDDGLMLIQELSQVTADVELLSVMVGVS